MAAARGGAQRPAVLAGHEAALLGHLRANPDATLAELRRWLFETRGVSISVGALWNGLDRLGWTLKKSRSTRPSRSAPTSPPRARPGAPSNQA
jgi:transposase